MNEGTHPIKEACSGMEDILMAGREKRVERSWEIPEIHGIPICSLHDTINAFSLLVT
jgi:hypothetical protein